MKRWLEIGPGEERLEGPWITLDVVERPGLTDYVCRWGAEPLPWESDTLELIHASHVLEHIPWHQTLAALREAWRVLAPGGVLELHVPDLDVLAAAARHECCPDDFAEGGVNEGLHWMHWVAERLFHFGEESQWHRACFNESHLTWCLRHAGFVNLQRIENPRGNGHGIINLGMSAQKAGGQCAPAEGLAVPARWPEEAFILAADDAEHGKPVAGAEDLPACHSRREYDSAARVFFCAHPGVHASENLVDRETCRLCQRWQEPPPEEFRLHSHVAVSGRGGPCWHLGKLLGLRECASCRGKVKTKVYACQHVRHETTTIDACMRCPDYDPRLTRGSVKTWAVGVTAAPRKSATLPRTLASLRAAGWDSPVIFAEPETPVVELEIPVEVVRRSQRLGEWPNWYLGLSELYQRSPAADAYLMVQDDVLFCRNLRAYLEAALLPAETPGVISLYNPLEGEDAPRGFVRYSSAGGLPGALALIFPNAAARLFLSDSQVLLHRRRGPSVGSRLTDAVVGEWAHRSGLSAFLHEPSLCQHIGDTSSVWDEPQDATVRRAASFLGEAFDVQCVSTSSPTSTSTLHSHEGAL